MDLKALSYFVEVAMHRSFSRAAEKLLKSQPAISHKLHELELELGLKLFDRDGRRISLTAEGQELLGRAKRILRETSGLSEAAKALATNRDVLRVGAAANTIERVVPILLPSYQLACPAVDVLLTEAGGLNLLSALESGDIDVALTRYVLSETFAARSLFPTHIVAALPEGNSLARKNAVSIYDLSDQPLLLSLPSFAARSLFDQAAKSLQVYARAVFESQDMNALVALAALGHGIAIVPSTVNLERRGLKPVPILVNDKPLGTWMSVVWNRRRAPAPRLEAFIKYAGVILSKRYPGSNQKWPALQPAKSALIRAGVALE